MLKKTITALSLLCILAACQSDDNSSPQPKPRKDIALLHHLVQVGVVRTVEDREPCLFAAFERVDHVVVECRVRDRGSCITLSLLLLWAMLVI